MDEKKPRELYNFKIGVWLVPAAGGDHKKKGHGTATTTSTNTLEDAKHALLQTAEERKIMYSSYGSPYEVHLEHVKATPADKKKGQEGGDKKGLIEVQALAVAKRRRDLPRLAEKEHGSSEDEEAAADDEMQRRGYRTVTAHFKSSHCPVCGSEFQPGQHIAKPFGEHSRGGWAHSTCLANRLEPVMEEGGN